MKLSRPEDIEEWERLKRIESAANQAATMIENCSDWSGPAIIIREAIGGYAKPFRPLLVKESDRMSYFVCCCDYAKWGDLPSWLWPVDAAGELIGKYVGDEGWTIRRSIDAAIERDSDG